MSTRTTSAPASTRALTQPFMVVPLVIWSSTRMTVRPVRSCWGSRRMAMRPPRRFSSALMNSHSRISATLCPSLSEHWPGCLADMVLLGGGTPVVVPTSIDDGFKMSAEALDAAITPKTKWVLINSPSNPTGGAYSRYELKALTDVIKKYTDVWVLTDDIYEHLVYDDFKFFTPAQIEPELYSRTLTLNGVSKAYAMTGWRIGYGAGPKPLMAAMKKIQGQSTSHPCAIAQWAAVEALNGPQDVLETMLSTFTRRRKQTLDALNATEGINCVSPDGAFYIFASVEAHLGCRAPNGTVMQEDSDWVLALMEDQGVAVVPGSAFGTPGYFRLSFAAVDESLAEATRRIRSFVRQLE